MQKIRTLLPIFFSVLLSFPLNVAHAGACYEDPVYERAWSGSISTAAYVRNGACMDGTTILATLPSGTAINIIGETDGWYQVVTGSGTTGWVGQWLVSVTNTNGTQTLSSNTTTTLPSSSLLTHVKGRILLQVESVGEAWYVDPVDGFRYYMKDGATAYEMMRAFGLGISNGDLAKLQAGDSTLKSQLKGRILLQVEEHGEAYYVHPDTGVAHYMEDGDAAYELMRYYSLGITNANLNTVPTKEFVPLAEREVEGETISMSSFQAGEIPGAIDLNALNEQWLERINDLRAARGLRQLVLDQRLIDTATAYAVDLGVYNRFTHTRRNGMSSREWADTWNLNFTERDEPGGWVNNYFGENLTWGYTPATQEGVLTHLEESLVYMLAEESYNGPHYRTIYHEDWNAMGMGFYFEDAGNGYYKVWVAYHHASLE